MRKLSWLIVLISYLVKISPMDLIHLCYLSFRTIILFLIFGFLDYFFQSEAHVLTHHLVQLTLWHSLRWLWEVRILLFCLKFVKIERAQFLLFVFHCLLKVCLIFKMSHKVTLQMLLLEMVKILPQEAHRWWWRLELLHALQNHACIYWWVLRFWGWKILIAIANIWRFT